MKDKTDDLIKKITDFYINNWRELDYRRSNDQITINTKSIWIYNGVIDFLHANSIDNMSNEYNWLIHIQI